MRCHATVCGLTVASAAFFMNEAAGQETPRAKKAESAEKAPSKEVAVVTLLKTQLQAAQKVHRASVDKMQVKRVGAMLVLANSNHPNPEEAYTWSVRWLHAQRDLSETKDERITAFMDHHKRTKELREAVNTLVADTGVLLPFSAAAAADWYLAEAELWLLKERGK